MQSKEYYMNASLALAREALLAGDVPVGCVIVDSVGTIIAGGRNRREETGDATAHAEVEAIRAACAVRGNWHLEDCTLFVTLEPCPLCAGAILNARIGTVVYGAREEKSGSCGSVVDLFSEGYEFHPKVYAGVMKDECSAVLKEFFQKIR